MLIMSYFKCVLRRCCCPPVLLTRRVPQHCQAHDHRHDPKGNDAAPRRACLLAHRSRALPADAPPVLLQTFAKDSLQRELLKELYQAEVMNELMRESDHVVTRRKECVKMVSGSRECASVLNADAIRAPRSPRSRRPRSSWRLCKECRDERQRRECHPSISSRTRAGPLGKSGYLCMQFRKQRNDAVQRRAPGRRGQGAVVGSCARRRYRGAQHRPVVRWTSTSESTAHALCRGR